jgi:MFS transporter, SHS family, lactate transporter
MPDPLWGLSSTQRKVVLACYLGWTLDAFDFFLLVFVLKDIAAEFNSERNRSLFTFRHFG